MIPKKNPKADLERSRGHFFLIGLGISLIAVITVLQWQKEIGLKTEDPHSNPTETVFEPKVPVTIQEKKKPQKKKKLLAVSNKIDPTNQIDNYEPDLDLKNLLNTGDDDDSEELVDIGMDDDENEETVPVQFALIQGRIALPPECSDTKSREEQMECLNLWLSKYLRDNVSYPRIAREMKLQDKVFATFIIGQDGVVESVKIERGAHESLNEEAQRVLQEMPEFIPAHHLNKKVRMQMTVPVNFRLR